MKKGLVIIVIALIFSSLMNGQTVGGSLIIASPQGEFRQYVDNLGFGFQLQGTLWSPGRDRPFTIGLDASYIVYGSRTDRRPFSETIPDVSVDVTRTNNIANMHLLFQISPFTGDVRPYIEGFFGGAYIFTTTEIKSDYQDQNIASTTNYDDFSWSYGAGGGILFKIAHDVGDVQSLYIDLKARYTYGSEAKYLTQTGIVINPADSRVYYFPVKSNTDLLTFQIGVVAYFNAK
jgi:hypothetical protein